jgi:formylglycine-generating enzyme required for sulfatase activity
VTLCPVCDTRQKPGNLFCGRCGKPLPEAVPAKAREGAARRTGEETQTQQKTAEARRLATSEALRIAEEQRRREQEAKRKADEERIAQTARETAARQSTMAAAIEAGKKAYQEEKRKVQLAEEAHRRDEEQQLRARELQRRAEEDAARQAEEEQARLTVAAEAERVRKETEARAFAEQELRRIKEVQEQQAEHERLAAELHRRAKEDEKRRATKGASLTQSGQETVKTPDLEVESETDSDAEPQISAAVPEVGLAQSDEHDDASDSSDIGGAAEFVTTSEYVPSWDQPSAFTSPARRGPRLWLVGLVIIGAIVVMLTVISLKQRVNTEDNANVRPTPTEPAVPVGMVRIPGGEFSMGSDRTNADEQEKPAHKETVTAFYIDATEVTCEEYQKFVKATGHKAPAKWLDGSCPSGDALKPVTGVDWYDASAYAKWVNKRLPTEEEWEFAARGTDGRRYPWGNEWKDEAANAGTTAHKHLAEVREHKEGASPFGAFDMVGNAWEWTASKLVPYPGGRLAQEASDDLRVIRGGSWQSDKDSATTTYRFGWRASGGKDYDNTSFRCARDITQR